MTVIVGLETNKTKEKAVVLGTDRLHLNGEPLIADSLIAISSDSIYNLEDCFRFLQERRLDKVKLSLGRQSILLKGRWDIQMRKVIFVED